MSGPGFRRVGVAVEAVGALLVSAWHFLPLFLSVRLDPPPYAFGHEPVGVRFGSAWRWLRDGQDYFYVPAGHLLDLVNRATLAILMSIGINPEADFVFALKMFSRAGLVVHALAMSVLSTSVIFSRKLPPIAKVGILAVGVSLGYAYHWGPIRLFYPDYHLSMNVLVYAALIFVARMLVEQPENGQFKWFIGGLTLTVVLLSLKLSLVPWVLIVLCVMTCRYRGARARWRMLAGLVGGAGALLILLAFVWVHFHIGLLTKFAADTARFLLTVKGAEPAFHGIADFIRPETVYGPLLWLALGWMVVAVWALTRSEDRALSLITLVGGAVYLYALSRRPGDAMAYEIAAFVTASGMLCALCLKERARVAMGCWSLILGLQAVTMASTVLPSHLAGVRQYATVAADIDAHVKAAGLDAVYFVRDDTGLYQSAATAAFKGAWLCGYMRRCAPEKRAAMISALAGPYRFVLPDEPFTEPARPFLVLYVDVRGEEPGRQLTALARRIVESAVQCRSWQQHPQIHLCVAPKLER